MITTFVLVISFWCLGCLSDYRGLTNTPFSNSDSLFIHVHSLINPTPSSYWGQIKRPYPTNSWYSNLGYSQFPVTVFPYLVNTIDSGGGIIVCYPQLVAQQYHYTSSWHNDIYFYINGLGNHYIINQTTLGVITAWDSPINGPSLRIPWVPGHPYLTFIYDGSVFNISTDFNITLLNGNPPVQGVCITSTKFQIQLTDPSKTHGQQTWDLWVLNDKVNLCYNSNGRTDVTGPHPVLTGVSSLAKGTVIRMAILNNDTIEDILDKYANNIVVGGSVTIPENIGSSSTTNITFTWDAIDSSQNSLQTEDILMLGLPHHADCIDLSTLKAYNTLPDVFSTIKGSMIDYIGSSWTLKENLTDIQWFSRSPIDSSKTQTIINQLKIDVDMQPIDNDTYGFGKFVASYARLVLIADQLGQTDMISTLLNRTKGFLGPWLYRVTYRSTFLYDVTWGGAISANGWIDNATDYGNGIYNDHHFHNGYYIYAGAVVLKYDPNWEWGPYLMDLARDIGNPSTADPYFPITRHKDWFVGHSWAQGLDATYDGKNQESTSEAVNAYYALSLYGLAISNDLVKNVGRVLLATEIRSTQKYWHTLPATIYPPVFADNAIVGIVWSDKADYATFFGSEPVYIHCIQMIPWTPISEDLLPASWVELEYPIIAPRLSAVPPVWQTCIIEDLAIINRDAAWAQIQTLSPDSFGTGDSLSNALWWIATRP